MISYSTPVPGTYSSTIWQCALTCTFCRKAPNDAATTTAASQYVVLEFHFAAAAVIGSTVRTGEYIGVEAKTHPGDHARFRC